MSKVAALVIILGLVTIAAGGPVSAQSPAAQRPTVRVGDTWTYSLRHKLSSAPDSQYVVSVTAAEPTQTIAKWQNPVLHESGTLVFDADANLIDNTRDPAMVTYHATPAFPGYQWPLSVGETWQRAFEYVVSGGRQYRATLTSQVTGPERVTVPAGTFDTYKITRKLDYQGFNGTNSWAGSESIVSWYAPQVKSFVRSETTDYGTYGAADTAIRELMSYRVQ